MGYIEYKLWNIRSGLCIIKTVVRILVRSWDTYVLVRTYVKFLLTLIDQKKSGVTPIPAKYKNTYYYSSPLGSEIH